MMQGFAQEPASISFSEEAKKGWEVLVANDCNLCHTPDGEVVIGPSYLGGWGGTRTVITDGVEREVALDEAYIVRSIYEPDADITKGFSEGLMMSYKETISMEDIKLIIEYLKELNE
jgi:cytochrome c oxidase subunit 2